MRKLIWIGCLALVTALSNEAQAHGRDVGLGVAAGMAYSPTKVAGEKVGGGIAWGFFVDIPIIQTFYISPAATLYELDLGNGKKPVTDIDLAFKFIVPIGSARLGAGILTGLTNAEQSYMFHYGALGYGAFNIVSNLDIFASVQYKRIERDDGRLEDIHGYLGAMFQL